MADDDSSNVDVNDILGDLGDSDSESDEGAAAPKPPTTASSAGKEAAGKSAAPDDEDEDDDDEDEDEDEDEKEGEEDEEDESGDSDASALLAAISSSARASATKVPVISSSDSDDDKPAAKAAPKAAPSAPKTAPTSAKAASLSSSESEDGTPAPAAKAAPKVAPAAPKAAPAAKASASPVPRVSSTRESINRASLVSDLLGDDSEVDDEDEDDEDEDEDENEEGEEDEEDKGGEEDSDKEEASDAAGSCDGNQASGSSIARPSPTAAVADGSKERQEESAAIAQAAQAENKIEEVDNHAEEDSEVEGQDQAQDKVGKAKEEREFDPGLSSPGTRGIAHTSRADDSVADLGDEETLAATAGQSLLSGTSGTSSPTIDRTSTSGTPAKRPSPGHREAPATVVAQPKPPERSRASAIQNWASLAAAADVPSLDEEGQLSVQAFSHPGDLGIHLDPPLRRGMESSLQEMTHEVDAKGGQQRESRQQEALLVPATTAPMPMPVPAGDDSQRVEETGAQHQEAPAVPPAPVTPPAGLVLRPYASSDAGDSRSSSEHDFLPDEDSPPASPSQDSRAPGSLQAASAPPGGQATLERKTLSAAGSRGLRGWGSTPGGRLSAARNSARELASPSLRQPSPRGQSFSRLQPADTSRPWPVPAARKPQAAEELQPLTAPSPSDSEGLLLQPGDASELAFAPQAAPLNEHELPGEQHPKSSGTATPPASREAVAGPREPVVQAAPEALAAARPEAHTISPAPAAKSSGSRRPEPWTRRSFGAGSAAERRSQSVQPANSGLEPCADGAGPAPRLEAEAPTAPPMLNSMARQQHREPSPASPPAERAVPRTQLSQPLRAAGRLGGPLRGRAKTVGPGTAGSLRARAKAASLDPPPAAARTVRQDAAAAPKRPPLPRSTSAVSATTTTTTTAPPSAATLGITPARATPAPPAPTGVPPVPLQAQVPAPAPARGLPQTQTQTQTHAQRQPPTAAPRVHQPHPEWSQPGYPSASPDRSQPGSIAAARERVLRMKEQVVALSSHCDALESMAVCSTSMAAGGGALAPAHAAAMRTATEQLAAWRSKEFKGPKLDEDPCAEAVARMREWIAEMAAEARCKETVRTLGDPPPAAPFLPATSVSLEGSQAPTWQSVTQPGAGMTAGNRPPLRTSGIRRLQQIPVAVEASHARRVTTPDEGAGPVGMVFLGSNGALRHTPSSGTPTPRTGSGVAPVPNAQWWAEALTHFCTDTAGTKPWSTPSVAPSAPPCRAPSPRLTVSTPGTW